jgi:hypothetical protein
VTWGMSCRAKRGIPFPFPCHSEVSRAKRRTSFSPCHAERSEASPGGGEGDPSLTLGVTQCMSCRAKRGIPFPFPCHSEVSRAKRRTSFSPCHAERSEASPGGGEGDPSLTLGVTQCMSCRANARHPSLRSGRRLMMRPLGQSPRGDTGACHAERSEASLTTFGTASHEEWRGSLASARDDMGYVMPMKKSLDSRQEFNRV